MTKKLKYPGCPQCGARVLEWDDNMLKCEYCDSVFEVIPEPEPKVIIHDGADVVFGGDVEIVGSVKIEPGAKVSFEGKLKLVKNSEGKSSRSK